MKATVMAEAMLQPGYRSASGNLTVTLASTSESTEDSVENIQQKESRSVPDDVGSFLPYAKRQKPAALATAKRVTEDIANSVSAGERLASIVAACSSFDHSITTVHDEEMEAGAPSVLCKHLAFLLMKKQLSSSTDDENAENELWREVGYTCSALEMVFRCSTSKLAESFHMIGSEVLPLLLTVMANCVQKSEEGSVHGASSKESIQSVVAVTIMKATKILGHFATVTTALVPMAYQRGLLSMMKRVAVSKVADKARFNALWSLANLACDADNMVLIACHPGLLDSLVDVAYGDKSFEARTHAAKTIMNLAWRPENKIPMSERKKLLDAMVKLLGSSVTKARRHAARAFRFLSDTPPKNKVRLCRHGDGSLLAAVVKRINQDSDRSVRESTMTTLHNLACEETSEMMGGQRELLLSLSKAAVVAERGTAPTIAGEALYVLSEHITERMACYSELQKSLEVVVSGKAETSPSTWSPRQQNILRRLANMRE